jgi:hypothetical protein
VALRSRAVFAEYRLGERGRSARLVSVQQPGTRACWIGGNICRGGYRSRGLKSDEVGNGSQGGRTAEGTILEIRLTLRMVVMAMVRRSAAVRWAEFHEERAAARGHESHRDIRTKQKRGQQYAGQHIASPRVTEPSLHDLGASPCQSQRHSSSAHRGMRRDSRPSPASPERARRRNYPGTFARQEGVPWGSGRVLSNRKIFRAGTRVCDRMWNVPLELDISSG